jgi:hypothetical protein
MIIQTIGLDPSGAAWTDGSSNVSRLDPSGAVQVDAEHPARNRKVERKSKRSLSACRAAPSPRSGGTGDAAVILAVIPPGLTEPNQTALTRSAAQPDLPRPDWTVETRRWAVIS